MIKVTNEQYLPLSIRLNAAEVLEIRKKIIMATAKSFRPDFFIVDKAPLGIKREILETLHWLRTDLPSCKSVLGLRDIMDSAATTIVDWRDKGIYEAMEELYHEIWVSGCRTFYDPVVEYRIPPQVASKIHFTGYIPRQIPSPEDVRSVRAELGIAEHDRVLLLTTGGGGDGYPVLNTFLQALEQNPLPAHLRVVVVTGPFISSRHFPEVARRCRQSGFIPLKFHRYMEALIGITVVLGVGAAAWAAIRRARTRQATVKAVLAQTGFAPCAAEAAGRPSVRATDFTAVGETANPLPRGLSGTVTTAAGG